MNAESCSVPTKKKHFIKKYILAMGAPHMIKVMYTYTNLRMRTRY